MQRRRLFPRGAKRDPVVKQINREYRHKELWKIFASDFAALAAVLVFALAMIFAFSGN